MQRCFFALIVTLAIISVCTGIRADVVFVASDATGANDGTSWTDAYTDLQVALSNTATGEIWVKAGTYTPGSARTDSYSLKNNVAVYGGFAGDEDPATFDLADRDFEAYETIISGDIGTIGDNADNCYHVFYHPDGTDLDSTAILDGVTITGGNANGSGDHNEGGGMCNYSGSPTVTNCTFTGNSAISGAGMYNRESSSPTLTNCIFSGNSTGAGGGAGMYNRDSSSPTLTNCIFSGNSTGDYGGGAGMLNHSQSSPTLTNCMFNGNSTSYFGYGGGMCNAYDSSPTLTSCTFSGNLAIADFGSGGGMCNAYDSSPALTNCTFSGNSADNEGGGMYNEDHSNPTLTNCTFSGNSADEGGGMYNYYYNDPTLTNCILWGNTASGGPQIYNFYSDTPDVTYSCVEGGHTGTGNIGELPEDNPQFVRDPDPGPDGNWDGVDDDYGNLNLLPGSPCIDSGDNSAVPSGVTIDIDENPRFANDPTVSDTGNGTAPIVDMGAYENKYKVVYVAADATGANNGTSWADAYTDLQTALANTSSGNIWVKADTYTPGSARTDSYSLKNNVAVYGGFAGNEDPATFDLDDRDLVANETILSGDLNGDDNSISDYSENSYHVFYHPSGTNLDSTAVLDGVTIAGGNANGSSPHSDGGGICNYGSHPTLTKCTFYGNLAGYNGGAMYNSSSNPTLDNCMFRGNLASYDGGGMYNENSNPTLINCMFCGNLVHYDGGGMYNENSNPTLTNCMLRTNVAENDGGGMYNNSSNPTLTNCMLNWNFVYYDGGGMCNKNSNPMLTNCMLIENYASFDLFFYDRGGGGMSNFDSSAPMLTNCILWGNAAFNGPVLFNENATPTLGFCDVAGSGGSANWDSTLGADGGGNIDADPMFASSWGGNYRLLPGSPCIDKGDNASVPADVTTDLDGNPRITDGDEDSSAIVDMGAFEYAGFPTPTGLASRRLHSGVGDVDLMVPLDGRFISSGESRMNGVTKLVYTFSEPIAAADATPDATEVELSAGTVDAVTINGNTMVVDLHGVPNASCLKVVLNGLVDLQGNRLLGTEAYLRILAGDVTGDGAVNTLDYIGVRGQIGKNVDESNCEKDINTDGVINTLDYIAIRAKIGTTSGDWP